MKKIVFITFIIFFPILSKAKLSHYIEPGEILKLSVPSNLNVHISTKKYLMIEDLYSQLKLVGKRSGKTVINIGSQIHIVYVVPDIDKMAINKVSSALESMIGLEMIINDSRPIITGQLHRLIDWITIHNAFSGSEFDFKAKIDPDLKSKIKKYFKNQLTKLPIFDDIRLQPFPEIIYYNVPENQKDPLNTFYKKWGINNILYITDKESFYDKTVEINLEFYEVSLNASKAYGLDWVNSLGFKVAPSTAIVGDLSSQLKLLIGQGDAKLVQRSSLKTANTHSVKFVAGGEIAIPQYSYKSKSVTWKTYGLQLEFTPKIINNKIQTQIKAEVSDLHESQNINGIPGLKTNKYESLLRVKQNQPVVISGLIKKRQQKTTEGVLGISEIPIVGELFKSSQYMNNESELVVIMTVNLVGEE